MLVREKGARRCECGAAGLPAVVHHQTRRAVDTADGRLGETSSDAFMKQSRWLAETCARVFPQCLASTVTCFSAAGTCCGGQWGFSLSVLWYFFRCSVLPTPPTPHQEKQLLAQSLPVGLNCLIRPVHVILEITGDNCIMLQLYTGYVWYVKKYTWTNGKFGLILQRLRQLI